MGKTVSSEYFFILGHAYTKRSVYAWCLGLLLAALGAFCAFGLYLRELNDVEEVALKHPEVLKDKTSAEGMMTRRVTSGSALSVVEVEDKQSGFLAPITIENLIKNHRLASGFDTVKNYMLVGTFGIDVGKTEINLKARAPNYYKFKTRYIDHGITVEFGFDGEQIWIGALPPQKSEGEVDAFKITALIESSLTHLAWCLDTSEAIDNGLGLVLELRPEESWNGRNYYVVRSRNILPVEMDHYIDQGTYLEAFRQVTITDGSGKSSRIRVEFETPDALAEHRIPLGYSIFADDELRDVVKFDKIKVNQVMFEEIFNSPGDL